MTLYTLAALLLFYLFVRYVDDIWAFLSGMFDSSDDKQAGVKTDSQE
jgi:hypothetical protein